MDYVPQPQRKSRRRQKDPEPTPGGDVSAEAVCSEDHPCPERVVRCFECAYSHHRASPLEFWRDFPR